MSNNIKLYSLNSDGNKIVSYNKKGEYIHIIDSNNMSQIFLTNYEVSLLKQFFTELDTEIKNDKIDQYKNNIKSYEKDIYENKTELQVYQDRLDTIALRLHSDDGKNVEKLEELIQNKKKTENIIKNKKEHIQTLENLLKYEEDGLTKMLNP